MPTQTASRRTRSKGQTQPQKVELAGETFVILPEREYRRLKQSEQDLGDIAESERRLAEPDPSIPLSKVKIIADRKESYR